MIENCPEFKKYNKLSPGNYFKNLNIKQKLYLLENVAASSFNMRSSLRSFIMVSLTTAFSLSYLDLRLLSATSAVFLLDLSTVRRVAICSRFVLSNDFSLITCSWSSRTSSLPRLWPAVLQQKH